MDNRRQDYKEIGCPTNAVLLVIQTDGIKGIEYPPIMLTHPMKLQCTNTNLGFEEELPPLVT